MQHAWLSPPNQPNSFGLWLYAVPTNMLTVLQTNQTHSAYGYMQCLQIIMLTAVLNMRMPVEPQISNAHVERRAHNHMRDLGREL